MLRTGCLVKKRDEIAIMIRYFGGEVTGNVVGQYINREVRTGKRTGKVRSFDVPFTYSEGKIESLKGLASRRSSLGPSQKARIVNTYSVRGLTIYQLASMYHVSPSKFTGSCVACAEATSDYMVSREANAHHNWAG